MIDLARGVPVGYVEYNADRNAIQLRSCTREYVIASLALAPTQAEKAVRNGIPEIGAMPWD
jgi:hypothetical protein